MKTDGLNGKKMSKLKKFKVFYFLGGDHQGTVRGYLYMNQIYEHFGIKWNPEDLNELFFADNGPIYFEFEHVGGNNILIRIKH